MQTKGMNEATKTVVFEIYSIVYIDQILIKYTMYNELKIYIDMT